jgi:hypothetical protein
MRSALQRSKDALGEFEPSISVHVNRDGSVDGELRVVMGEKYQKRFPQVIANVPHMLGTWISVHDFWHPSIEDVYDLTDFLIKRGLAGIATHPVKAKRSKAQTSALMARVIADNVASGTDDKYKPLEVAIHLRWHPDDVRPKY